MTPVEWHVWGPTDTEPTIYYNPVLLQAALAEYKPQDVVIVHTYKRLPAGQAVYNGPGGQTLPSTPASVPRKKIVLIKHVEIG